MVYVAEPIGTRLRSRTEVVGECWVWRGRVHKRTGYGRIRWRGRHEAPHRIVAILLLGHRPGTGLMVLHRCNNRLCLRPSHLYVGTAKDNTRDMITSGRGWWQRKED